MSTRSNSNKDSRSNAHAQLANNITDDEERAALEDSTSRSTASASTLIASIASLAPSDIASMSSKSGAKKDKKRKTKKKKQSLEDSIALMASMYAKKQQNTSSIEAEKMRAELLEVKAQNTAMLAAINNLRRIVT